MIVALFCSKTIKHPFRRLKFKRIKILFRIIPKKEKEEEVN